MAEEGKLRGVPWDVARSAAPVQTRSVVCAAAAAPESRGPFLRLSTPLLVVLRIARVSRTSVEKVPSTRERNWES